MRWVHRCAFLEYSGVYPLISSGAEESKEEWSGELSRRKLSHIRSSNILTS